MICAKLSSCLAVSIFFPTFLHELRRPPDPAAMTPLASVILPVHDSAATLGEAVRSVLDQSIRELECIVVDDGSSDQPEKALAPYQSDSRLVLIRRPHGGAGAARNTGVAAARGSWLAFQDAQDIWLPEKLAHSIRAVESAEDTRVRLAHTGWWRVKLDGSVRAHPGFPSPKRAVMDTRRLRPGVAGIPMQSVVCHRDLFDEAGPFDETLPRFIDLDWLLRVRRKARFVHLPEPMVIWREHAGGITANTAAMAPALRQIRAKHEASLDRDDPSGLARAVFAALIAYADVAAGQAVRALGDLRLAARHAADHHALADYLRRVMDLARRTGGVPSSWPARWSWSRLESRLGAVPAVDNAPRGFWPDSPEATPAENYPAGCRVSAANEITVDFVRSLSRPLDVAEIGVYHGHTSRALAAILARTGGTLHLFDFDDRVRYVADLLRADGHTFVQTHGNSRKTHDSYNWSLKQILETTPDPCFDYVFLGGAHTWAHDALAFLLADRLLRPGGHIDFDDYDWSLARSPTLRPSRFPRTADDFTSEQIECRQVQAILDLLVRRDDRYVEVVPQKIFRKIRA